VAARRSRASRELVSASNPLLKTALLVVVLGFSAWSAPAWALSFHEGNARDKAKREDSTSAKHADLSFRSQTSELGSDATPGRWTEEHQRGSEDLLLQSELNLVGLQHTRRSQEATRVEVQRQQLAGMAHSEHFEGFPDGGCF